MPTVRMFSVHCLVGRDPQVPQQRTPAAAVVVSTVLAAAAVLAGCEYSYDDGRSELPGTPVVTDAALPRDPLENLPVKGAALDAWAKEVLPDAEGQVFHTNYGIIAAGRQKT